VTRLPSSWLPGSEADIQRAIDNDCLRESHYLDCKREIGLKADRKETARDLASFAIDGGGLLIGVHEDKEKQVFSLAPQPLAGLAERVEDIAWSTIDLPLEVIPHEIKSDQGGGLGYLMVEVRPSPFAPHMVDGVYYGRGEKKRVRLTDPQVRRYHAQRQPAEERVGRLLDEEIARDPIPLEARTRGHLYLVAYPLTAPQAVARSLIRKADMMELHNITHASEKRLHGSELPHMHPSVDEASHFHRRARGAALCSLSASGPGRTVFSEGRPSVEDQYLDIEFQEDGSIRALVGRATCDDRIFADKTNLVIFDWLIVSYGIRLTGWAAALGRRLGYYGSWGLGLHASGLRGLQGASTSRRTSSAPRFDAEYHRMVTIASTADLEDRWQQIAGELVGSLLFVLGVPRNFFNDLVIF
jgi:hypothetical protein